jgi:hypothetical protein
MAEMYAWSSKTAWLCFTEGVSIRVLGFWAWVRVLICLKGFFCVYVD